MMTLVALSNILLIYDNGNVWNEIIDIIMLITVITLSMLLIPITIILDIVCMPIEIFIFLMRKRHEEQFNEKYTIKDFINEVMG